MVTRILIIDDDIGLTTPLTVYFKRHDLHLEHAQTPTQGLSMLEKASYDFLILDIMLPEMDGFEVCRRVRAFSDIPIIMLTARGEVTDRIVGLELGADDYLPKPFEPRELVARIGRILQRVNISPKLAATKHPTTLKITPELTINQEQQIAILNGSALALTTREFSLLSLLCLSKGKLWTRDDIMNQLRGSDADVYSRVIDISISRLRKKLLPLDPIKTIWGQGYRWVA